MSDRLYGLVPAGGSGARLGAALPKQYLPLAGQPMLVHAVRALLTHAAMQTVFVVLAPDDVHFAQCDWRDDAERVRPLYCAGASRRDTVYNGLVATRNLIDPDEWVLVHDAARPGLSRAALQRLVDAVRDDAVGGLLAVPVADTLKRADAAQRVLATEPRTALWAAQTPQMFRHGTLLRALDAMPDATDEAGAVERLGLRPLLVPGDGRNFKITYPGDVALAARLMEDENP